MSQVFPNQQKDRFACVALGSNVASAVGSPLDTVRFAIKKIWESGLCLGRISHLYEAPAIPAGSGPNFVNAVVRIEGDLPPQDLLEKLHAIEADLGRVRRIRWAPRSLDLDLLCSGDAILPNPDEYRRWMRMSIERQVEETPENLILPHPRLQDRGFVLVPMSDVASDWRHPVLGRTVREMLAALPESEITAIRPIAKN
ncbi:MAG: 2-amino-4-hydroxy-6-hydroxymethyldihydropteridine diphosphokinase [Pseudomonadota bacterium]